MNRRSFVLLTSGLAASIPFLGRGVDDATLALERAATPPKSPDPEPEKPKSIVGGRFFVDSVDMRQDWAEGSWTGGLDKSYIPGLMSVEIRLVSSGPISSDTLKILSQCPEIEFHVPNRPRQAETSPISGDLITARLHARRSGS